MWNVKSTVTWLSPEIVHPQSNKWCNISFLFLLTERTVWSLYVALHRKKVIFWLQSLQRIVAFEIQISMINRVAKTILPRTIQKFHPPVSETDELPRFFYARVTIDRFSFSKREKRRKSAVKFGKKSGRFEKGKSSLPRGTSNKLDTTTKVWRANMK